MSLRRQDLDIKEADKAARINNWTVGLAGGLLEGTFSKYAADMGKALDEIEKLGGMDPFERRRSERDELPNCVWRDAETPFAKNH